MSRTRLSAPPEPVELKRRIRALHEELRASLGDRSSTAAAWVGMLLPSYLWRFWGEELKDAGVTWQGFLSALKLHSRDVARWAIHEELPWQDLVARVARSLERRKGEDLLSYLAGEGE